MNQNAIDVSSQDEWHSIHGLRALRKLLRQMFRLYARGIASLGREVLSYDFCDVAGVHVLFFQENNCS